MQVRIRTRRLEISRAERARVERRVRLALGARVAGIARVDVALVGEAGARAGALASPCRCRVTLWPRLGAVVRAESEGDDPVEAAGRAAHRAARGCGLRTEGGLSGPRPRGCWRDAAPRGRPPPPRLRSPGPVPAGRIAGHADTSRREAHPRSGLPDGGRGRVLLTTR